jgi:hypothetical protein
MLKQHAPIPEMASSQTRRSIADVPHRHAQLSSRVMYLRTKGGVDFELKLVENTTQAQAIVSIEQRLKANADARREGKPLGVYTGPKATDLPKKEYISLDMRVGGRNGERYNIHIEMEGNGYKVGTGANATYEVSLRQAVELAANRADMRLAAMRNEANAYQATQNQESGYRAPGMRT